MLKISARYGAALSNLLFCLAPCLAAADVSGQIQAACDSDPSLASVLAREELQPLGLVYSERLIQPHMKAIGAPQGTIKDRVTAWLSPYGMALMETEAGNHLITQRETPPTFTAGQLLDEQGLPLANMTVKFQGLRRSAQSSGSGCFLVQQVLPEGTQLITVEGFESFSFPASEEDWVTVQLERPERTHIVEVSVIGSRYQMMQASSQTSLGREDIAYVPHLGDDITRIFSRLPGTAAGDYSPKVNVRGGMPNEHVMYMDGLELHKPWYFKGLDGIASIVDSNIIESVDFLSGGFTADYGGRTSGLTNITTLEPHTIPTTLGASFMTAFAQTGGTLNDGRQGWLVSVRSGFLDLAFQLAGVDADVQPRYSDVFSKIQTELGEYNTLALNVLSAHDDFELRDGDDFHLEEQVKDGSSNSNLWLTLNTDFDGLQATNILSLTDFSHRLTGYEAQPSVAWLDERSYKALGFRSDWTVAPLRDHLFKFGVDLKRLEADYDYHLFILALPHHDNPDRFETTQRQANFKITGEDRAAYAAYRIRLMDRLTMEAGARWTQQTYMESQDRHTAPRVNAVYEILPSTQINLSWGEFHQAQAIDDLYVGDGQTEFFPAQVAEHSVLGVQHAFSEALTARLDIYKKDYSSVHPRYENLYDGLGIFIKEAVGDRVFIDPDRSISEGIEMGFTYDEHRHFSGWANYSYSKVDDYFGNQSRPRSKDQRHSANVNLNWDYERWNFNLSGLLRSGWPYTPITYPENGGEPYTEPADYNSERLDYYTRFDVRLTRKMKLVNGDFFQYYFEIYNVLNSDNKCCTRFESDDDGNRVPQFDAWMPLLPSFGVRYVFN